MEQKKMTEITIEAAINANVQRVWDAWTNPVHIINWNFASVDWHSPRATNDLRKGGSFSSRMEAKDGSMGFDFEGIYDEVVEHRLIHYTLGDGRKVKVTFEDNNGATRVEQTFEAEDMNNIEMQREGWQAILNNFKHYIETT